MYEIERKFLVKGDFSKDISESYKIMQGFLSRVPERTVRVRILDNKAYLTIKGITTDEGTSRYEFETEIELNDAENLMKICEPGIIEKVRHIIFYGDKKFEVDVFGGKNRGLVIAEIELNNKDEKFLKPVWLGEEVTGNIKYYNSNL